MKSHEIDEPETIRLSVLIKRLEDIQREAKEKGFKGDPPVLIFFPTRNRFRESETARCIDAEFGVKPHTGCAALLLTLDDM
jgi:hypothetical protein